MKPGSMESFLPRRNRRQHSRTPVTGHSLNPTRTADSANWDSSEQEDFDYESAAAGDAEPKTYTPVWRSAGGVGHDRH